MNLKTLSIIFKNEITANFLGIEIMLIFPMPSFRFTGKNLTEMTHAHTKHTNTKRNRCNRYTPNTKCHFSTTTTNCRALSKTCEKNGHEILELRSCVTIACRAYGRLALLENGMVTKLQHANIYKSIWQIFV